MTRLKLLLIVAGVTASAFFVGNLFPILGPSTTAIVLESANFNASSVRKTSAALKLRTDASIRFEKAQDPHNTIRALARALSQDDEWVPSRRERKKVEMLFAHLKRILKLDRLRLRGPNGAKDEFHLAAAAQNLRKLAKMRPMPGLAPA